MNAPRSWPLMTFIADFTQGPPGIPGGNSVSLMDGKTALRGWSSQRGRQYELGQVQSGTLSVNLTDASEYLNPVNASSPWNSGANSLLPYRCLQLGAWWNSTTLDATGNMLNASNLVLGSNTIHYDPSFESSTSGWFDFTGTATVTTSTAQHFVGAQSLAAGFIAGTDIVEVALPGALVAGQQYTVSIYVFVPASHTVTASFMNASNTLIASATSTTTAAWQRLTMTGVPTQSFAALQVKIATGTAPVTVFLDAMQMEIGPTASAFSTAGPTFSEIYTGYVERYPQTWDSQGFRGIKPLEAVDALSPLSRAIISQSYAQTIAADGPQVYIPYNDSSAPQAVQRPTGGQPMIGFTQLGSNSGAASFSGDSFLDGSKALSATQQNTDPVTFLDNTQMTWVGTRQGSIYMNPQSFAWEGWIRITSGVMYFGVGSMDVNESTIGSFTPKFHVALRIFGGRVSWEYVDSNMVVQANIFAVAPANHPTGYFPDGIWRYVAITFVGSNQFRVTTDGVTSGLVPFTSTPPVMALDNLFLVAGTYFGDPITDVSVANVALYSSPLSPAQNLNHYRRGIGYLGEFSGTRAARILTQYWSSNITADVGKTQMANDFSYNGRSVLEVLQEIADTEGGLTWADAAGFVHQDSREIRYVNSATSLFTFGERADLGELPYSDIEYDYDPTYVYSEADLTAASGTIYKNINATSQTAYGQRILSKTMQMANDWDVGQAASFYTQRYAKPAGAPGTSVPPRISKLSINPGANKNLFTAALTLDVGSRVTVKRRTSPGITITGDYYIEQISPTVDTDQGTWVVDYQLSPVFNPTVWILGDATKGVLGSTTVCVY